MAFPYKKMDQADFSAIQSFTDTSRVWIGEDIPYEYHHDEMPEYGIYAPECYVEVINKEEISKIMAYANQYNIAVVIRGLEQDWPEGLPVNMGESCFPLCA